MSLEIQIYNGVDFETIAPESIDTWKISMPGGSSFFASVNLIGSEYYLLSDPFIYQGSIRLKIISDGTTYDFLIEERRLNLTVSEFSFEIRGRSKQALIADPDYCGIINDFEETAFNPVSGFGHPWQGADTTATAAITTALTDYGAGVVSAAWNPADFLIINGVFEAQNMLPLDVVKKIADTIGAEIIAEIDGTLTVQEYLIDGTGQTPVATYSDTTDDIFSLSDQNDKPGKRYNKVVVFGQNDTVTNETTGDAEPEPPPAYLNAVSHPDNPEKTLPGFWHKTRLYYYRVTEGTVVTIFPDWPHIFADPATGNQRTTGTSGTEEKSETILLKKGQGSTSQPDEFGNQLVTVDADANLPFSEKKDHTYNTSYIDFEFKSDTIGHYKFVFYYDDGSAEAYYEFDIEINDPQLIPVKQTEGDINIDTDHTVRVYNYNYYNTPIGYSSSDDSVITPGTTGTENYTETINLKFGKGQYSLFDTNGNKDYYDENYVNYENFDVNISYNVDYQDFDIQAPTEGNKQVDFSYTDLIVPYNYDVVPAAVFAAQTLVLTDAHSGGVPAAGVTVLIDEGLDTEETGTTDENGIYITAALEVGTSHTVKWTMAGEYQGSDEDLIYNDSFVAMEAVTP